MGVDEEGVVIGSRSVNNFSVKVPKLPKPTENQTSFVHLKQSKSVRIHLLNPVIRD